LFQKNINEFFEKLSELLLSIEVTGRDGAPLSLEDGAEQTVQMMLDTKSAAQKVLLAGNGGSSAIVSHVQNDLCKATGVKAMVFTEQPLLTALANDEGYGSVFEWPINMWAESNDLFMTVSSSGQSENIVRGLKAAREKGCRVITMSGFDPNNTSRELGDLNFYVPSSVYAYVETAHTALAHYLTTKAAG
jgi:D-sedoheptulose 7-phosphate isomerase